MSLFNEISIDELAGRIQDSPSELALLMGAGCSKGAGIPDSKGFIAEVAKHLGKDVSTLKDYAAALRALGSLADQQRFVANVMKDAKPGEIHTELAALMQRGLFSVIFTTNFDHLIETQLGRWKRPVDVVKHEGQAEEADTSGALKPSSNHSYVIKLHGDYGVPGILNHPWQTSTLSKHMKKLFHKWVFHHGLLVVGYGSNDQSVRITLEEAAGEQAPGAALPIGLVWVARHKSKIPSWVETLAESRPAPWIDLLRVADAEELFRELRRALIKDLSPHWERVRKQAVGRTQTDTRSINQHIQRNNVNLYESRRETEKVFADFRRSKTTRGLVYVDRSGAGKSVLLAHLAD